MLCWSRLYKVTQLQIYLQPLPRKPPSQSTPRPDGQVITEPRAEFLCYVLIPHSVGQSWVLIRITQELFKLRSPGLTLNQMNVSVVVGP